MRQAIIATPPPSPGGRALIVWAPGLSTVPDTPSALPLYDAPLLACPVGAPCAQIGGVHEGPGVWPFSKLLLGGNGNVVAANISTAYLSRDGGRTFATLALPKDALVPSAALAGPDWTPWISWLRADGSNGVSRLDGEGWVDVSQDLAHSGNRGELVAVGRTHIMAAMPPRGFRCTMTSGGPWLARCSSPV
jgi:hypothetical protein